MIFGFLDLEILGFKILKSLNPKIQKFFLLD
jgi:hypothetical protein